MNKKLREIKNLAIVELTDKDTSDMQALKKEYISHRYLRRKYELLKKRRRATWLVALVIIILLIGAVFTLRILGDFDGVIMNGLTTFIAIAPLLLGTLLFNRTIRNNEKNAFILKLLEELQNDNEENHADNIP